MRSSIITHNSLKKDNSMLSQNICEQNQPTFSHCNIGHTVVGSWHKIHQTDINQFADATNDHQWIHTDPERAAQESPFGSTIAHGLYCLSLMGRMAQNNVEIFYPEAKSCINYAIENVRFRYPVKVGTNIRGLLTVENEVIHPRFIQVKVKVSIEIEGIKKPGISANIILRIFH
jgi:acyl dehydratase